MTQNIKFHFQTEKGFGHVTLNVPLDADIAAIGMQLLETFKGIYDEVTLVRSEILPLN